MSFRDETLGHFYINKINPSGWQLAGKEMPAGGVRGRVRSTYLREPVKGTEWSCREGWSS